MTALNGISDILSSFKDSIVLNGENEIYVKDHKRFREKHLDSLLTLSISHENTETRRFLLWLIRRLALSSGVIPASLKRAYQLKSEGKFFKTTFPSLAFSELSYESAQSVFRAAQSLNCRAFLLEMEPKVHSTPLDFEYFGTIALAAALREGCSGPLFLQVAPVKIAAVADIESWKNILRFAIQAGFYNFEVDATALADTSAVTLEEQQKPSCAASALIVKYISESMPTGVEPCISVAIAASNKRNTSLDDIRIFLDSFVQSSKGIMKVSVEDEMVDYRTLNTWKALLGSTYHLAGVRIKERETAYKTSALESFAQSQVAEVRHSRFDLPNLSKDVERIFRALGVIHTLEAVVNAEDAPKVLQPIPDELKKWVTL